MKKILLLHLDVSEFISSFRLLSSSLDSIVKTLVDNIHERLKNSKKEVVSVDNLISIFL